MNAEISIATDVTGGEFWMGDPVVKPPTFFLTADGCPMTVLLETSMVRPRSDVVRRDIRLSSAHPIAVGSDIGIGKWGYFGSLLLDH